MKRSGSLAPAPHPMKERMARAAAFYALGARASDEKPGDLLEMLGPGEKGRRGRAPETRDPGRWPQNGRWIDRPWSDASALQEPFPEIAILLSLKDAQALKGDDDAKLEGLWNDWLGGFYPGGCVLDEEGRRWPAARRAGRPRAHVVRDADYEGESGVLTGYGVGKASYVADRLTGAETAVVTLTDGSHPDRSDRWGLEGPLCALSLGGEQGGAFLRSDILPAGASLYLEWSRRSFAGEAAGLEMSPKSGEIGPAGSFVTDLLWRENDRERRASLRIALETRAGELRRPDSADSGLRLRLDGLWLDPAPERPWRLELDKEGLAPMAGGGPDGFLLESRKGAGGLWGRLWGGGRGLVLTMRGRGEQAIGADGAFVLPQEAARAGLSLRGAKALAMESEFPGMLLLTRAGGFGVLPVGSERELIPDWFDHAFDQGPVDRPDEGRFSESFRFDALRLINAGGALDPRASGDKWPDGRRPLKTSLGEAFFPQRNAPLRLKTGQLLLAGRFVFTVLEAGQS